MNAELEDVSAGKGESDSGLGINADGGGFDPCNVIDGR
jgi:hypothetical protein